VAGMYNGPRQTDCDARLASIGSCDQEPLNALNLSHTVGSRTTTHFSISSCQDPQGFLRLPAVSSPLLEPMFVCYQWSTINQNDPIGCQHTLCLVCRHMLRWPGVCYPRNHRRRHLPNLLSLAWRLEERPTANRWGVHSDPREHWKRFW